MIDTVHALLERYGYLAVVLGVGLENAGIPVPGETMLLAAAASAGWGVLSLPWVIGLATLGATVGDNLGYWIGRRGGRPLAMRCGYLIGLTPQRLAWMEGFFARHGAKTIFFARFITGLRVFGALVAGMSRVAWPRFLLYNATGAVVWATTFGVIGFAFAGSWVVLERWIGRASLVTLAVGVGMGLVVVRRRWRGQRVA